MSISETSNTKEVRPKICKESRGQSLRKTHYILGKDSKEK